MTIQNFLDLTDRMCPDGVSPELRFRWLGEIEGRVRVELMGEDPRDLPVIDADAPTEHELCVPAPYDRLYWLHHVAMCDFLAGDTQRYENAAAMFNEAYAGFGRFLKRGGA